MTNTTAAFTLLKIGHGTTTHAGYGVRAICGANQGMKCRRPGTIIGKDDASKVTCVRCRNIMKMD